MSVITPMDRSRPTGFIGQTVATRSTSKTTACKSLQKARDKPLDEARDVEPAIKRCARDATESRCKPCDHNGISLRIFLKILR
jgi:hypothetical protein